MTFMKIGNTLIGWRVLMLGDLGERPTWERPLLTAYAGRGLLVSTVFIEL